MNPLLLEKYETPFETVPFDQLKDEHFLPGLHQTIEKVRAEIEKIKTNRERETFRNVIVALEDVFDPIEKMANTFFNLNSAESSKSLQDVAKAFSPLLTSFYNDVLLDDELFRKVKKVYEKKESLNLSREEAMLLEKTNKSFERNGALLDKAGKERLREIDRMISENSLLFGDHVLAETNHFELWIDDEEKLKGLPESAKESAAHAAKEKGEKDKWLFTLHMPSFLPLLTYLDDRGIREKMYRANASRGFKDNENDNREIVKTIASLRYERAQLLGYKDHADFILEDRMAETPDKVMSFLKELMEVAKPFGEKEIQELQEFAKSNGGPDKLQKWDYFYWANKLKKEKFHLDDEELKPYFSLEKVIQGAFDVANKLYGVTFWERRDIPVYHEDVRTYEVSFQDGQFVGVLYGDFFPREGKRGGAWMTVYRSQKKRDGVNIRPHVSIVTNFSKPTGDKPSLLAFDEVLTLFHEFGHSLHALLTQCQFSTLSGANVLWDFVELPSQIMENWCYEKECLDLFAEHYETGEKIPAELVERIKKSASFHEGRSTVRQVNLALIDMAWHSGDPRGIKDVGEFEHEIVGAHQLLPALPEANVSCSFGHIFQGGYSAGYYSYKWAEVLDADAFALFKEKGIFDRETAESFLQNILMKGGSEPPMTLYKRFRGHEPDTSALFRRAGLIES